MNLDNYFAKYLSKRGEPAASAPGGHRPAPFTVAPPPPARAEEGPATLLNEGGRPSGESGREEAAQRLSAASSSAKPAQSSERSATPPARASGLEAASDGDRTVDSAVEDDSVIVIHSGRESAGKRVRDVGVAAKVETPVADRRRLRARVQMSSGDEDDDELNVLLGREKAQEVKRIDAFLADHAAPLAPPLTSSSTDAPSCTAVAVSTLQWGTRSNRKLEEYHTYFERQFEFELHSRPELMDSFEPFFKDRQLARIANDHSLNRVLLPPGEPVTAGGTGALAGCVLRDYQVAGVEFLLRNFHRGISCILSDDMGLGKTAQLSSFLHVLKLQDRIDGPHLVVAPLSTLTSWTRELARWAPQLRVLKYHGERRARAQARGTHLNRHAVVVTTPAVLNQDKGFFRRRAWVTVVMDEAHVLKGHDTNVTHTARKLHACFRVAVTGTPVHNNVREVWSLVSFLYPSLTAAYGGNPKDEEEALQAAGDCAGLLRHIMLRRTKESMELGIPPRTDEPVTMLEPTYIQSQVLSLLTARVLEEAEEDCGGTFSRPGQLQAHLSHQRAVCNHPIALRLLAAEERASGSTALRDRLKLAGVSIDEKTLVLPSAKMMYLDRVLPELKKAGHRCLIFSNFTTTLDILEAYCELRHFSYERLDGSCNRVERELSIIRFNAANSSCFLFLVTTTAGGVGVTLTGADTVFLFDAHFNPQLDRQAADRAHRIGQTRPVHVYRLCLHNTVEEHIRDIADRKASLGDLIVDGAQKGHSGSGGAGGKSEDGSVKLTADDIRGMLARLAARGDKTNTMSPTTADLAEREAGFTASASQRAEEDDVVADLVRIEHNGLTGFPAHGVSGSTRGAPWTTATTHHCFVCGDIMHPLEPLYHCCVCPKAYHADCIGLPRPKPGQSLSRGWSCPRHVCATCGKAQAADGAIFMCTSCPRAFCFDCLDLRYLELDAAGSQLLHVRKTYSGMADEGVEEKRSAYYIACLRCCGVVSSTSDEDSDEDAESGSTGQSSGSRSEGGEANQQRECDDEVL